MITAASLRRQIEAFCFDLLRHQMAVQYNPPLELTTNSGTIITWSRAPAISMNFGRFGTISEYRSFLRENDFSVLLVDGALIQITYMIDHGTISAHRLCFYPCPIVFTDEERAELTIEDLLDLTDTEWEGRVRLRSPIRFDYAPAAAATDHPSSHMTISEEHCRIAVAAPLSLGHFIRFIFRHFYPHLWMDHAFLRDISIHQCVRTLDEIDDDSLYIAWRRGT